MKNLSILGATGSIGRNTLSIVEKFPDRFSVKALTAAYNIELAAKQIEKFMPDIAAVINKERAANLEKRLSKKIKTQIVYGEQGYIQTATYEKSQMVVAAISGAAGLIPTWAALEAGKDIAIANKETLVMAGPLFMKKASEKGVKVFPIDSEHSAIFQSLQGNDMNEIDRLLITASGGPFIDTPPNEMPKIKPEDALKHPNWQMGSKITIDSATLMNKGLEVIEASALFSVLPGKIQVLVHRQSIVHSMVAFSDGSVMAQMGIPDMKTPIAYALSYPERMKINQPIPDFVSTGSLTFEEPDLKRFPCLGLAFEACRTGKTMPTVLNAANEKVVAAFLNKKLLFTQIPEIVKKTMENHAPKTCHSLETILEADKWSRIFAQKLIDNLQEVNF